MKKRVLSLLLALTMVFALVPAMSLTASADAAAWYSSGAGTESDPYIISSYAGLNAFAEYVNSDANSQYDTDVNFFNASLLS